MCTLISYGNLLLLGGGNDLGEKKTFLLLGVNACICLYGFVTKFGAAPEVTAIALEFLVLSLVSMIATRAKYIDKATRGTK